MKSTRTYSSSSASVGSAGVECLIDYLSSPAAAPLVRKIVLRDEKLQKEFESANFWSGGSFVVTGARCTGVLAEGLRFEVSCDVKGKAQRRDVVAPFPVPVRDETELKRVLVDMAVQVWAWCD